LDGEGGCAAAGFCAHGGQRCGAVGDEAVITVIDNGGVCAVDAEVPGAGITDGQRAARTEGQVAEIGVGYLQVAGSAAAADVNFSPGGLFGDGQISGATDVIGFSERYAIGMNGNGTAAGSSETG